VSETMKAIAVHPGTADSIHLTTMRKPEVSDVKGGRGVLVRVLRVGVDGTDKEINAAEYGKAPQGDDFLVTGHESLGIVEEVGPSVTGLTKGNHVVAMVRRPGSSIYDLIGEQDMTTDDEYFERGINLLHGYLAEYYVDDERYIVKLPHTLKEVGVLLEPLTIFEKGIRQAYEAQRRLKVWQPKKAAVMGAGTVGMLATLLLRIRGFDVTTFARNPKPNVNADLVERLGARYVITTETSITEGAAKYGPFDVVLEATGSSAVVFESMRAVGKNGVLVLASVTGGDKRLEVPADKINLEFVLGNKLMLGTVNAAREDFEQGVVDMVQAEAYFPGFLKAFLTHPVRGLESYRELIDTLERGKGVIKCYCVVSE
jgi:glucose 1-dehydrogenase